VPSIDACFSGEYRSIFVSGTGPQDSGGFRAPFTDQIATLSPPLLYSRGAQQCQLHTSSDASRLPFILKQTRVKSIQAVKICFFKKAQGWFLAGSEIWQVAIP
jgi:hypothetical protein